MKSRELFASGVLLFTIFLGGCNHLLAQKTTPPAAQQEKPVRESYD